MTEHRFKLARERAGLSLGQAAKLLGIERVELEHAEASTLNTWCGRIGCPGGTLHAHDIDDKMFTTPEQLAEVYGVNVPWLIGAVPQHDYEAMKDARGYDKLTEHDRDVVAEFAASIPRGGGTFADRVHRLKGPGRR